MNVSCCSSELAYFVPRSQGAAACVHAWLQAVPVTPKDSLPSLLKSKSCPPATQPTYAVSDVQLIKVASPVAQAVCNANKASNAGVAYDAGMAIGDAGMRVCVHVEPIASAKVPVAGKFVSELVSVRQQAFQNVVRSLIGVSVLCIRGSRHVRQQTGMLTTQL